jgi:hypothetical protein
LKEKLRRRAIRKFPGKKAQQEKFVLEEIAKVPYYDPFYEKVLKEHQKDAKKKFPDNSIKQKEFTKEQFRKYNWWETVIGDETAPDEVVAEIEKILAREYEQQQPENRDYPQKREIIREALERMAGSNR